MIFIEETRSVVLCACPHSGLVLLWCQLIYSFLYCISYKLEIRSSLKIQVECIFSCKNAHWWCCVCNSVHSLLCLCMWGPCPACFIRVSTVVMLSSFLWDSSNTCYKGTFFLFYNLLSNCWTIIEYHINVFFPTILFSPVKHHHWRCMFNLTIVFGMIRFNLLLIPNFLYVCTCAYVWRLEDNFRNSPSSIFCHFCFDRVFH